MWADPLERRRGTAVHVRVVAVDLLVAAVAVAPRAHPDAVRVARLGPRVLGGHLAIVGVRLDVVPGVAEGRPGSRRGGRMPVVEPRRAPVADALEREDVDLVARGAGNRIPGHDRDVRLVPGRDAVDVASGVGDVVAHTEVLDARRGDRRDLFEGLRKGRT